MTSRTHDNFRHNFWTWVDPTPPFEQCSKKLHFFETMASPSWNAESVSMGKSEREHVGIFLWSGKRCQSQSCESIYKVFFYWSSHQNFYSWTWSHPIRQKIQKVETSEWKSQSQFKDGVGRAKIQSGQVFSNHLIQECCQSSNHSGVPTCFFSLSPTNLMIIIIFQKH